MSDGLFAGLSLEAPRIFGIINVTPDSFSDGGEAFGVDDAVRRGRAMIEAGATRIGASASVAIVRADGD